LSMALRVGVNQRTARCRLAFAVVGSIAFLLGLAPAEARAAPSAETAKRCFRYSYIAHPYRRPGAVRMSGDRQAYFKDCMAREGNVPEPSPTPKS